jgi:uncharacterized protein
MARLFLDTSALVKLYHAEPNSASIAACIGPDDTLVLCDLALLEFRSAFYGLVRQRIITSADARDYISNFTTDVPLYSVQPVNGAVFQEAARLLDVYAAAHPLRPPDAIQLASALLEHALSPLDWFLTTDATLGELAILEGLTVQP